MAKKGKKGKRVKPHKRHVNGKVVHVKGYVRK
jgi:hypothetical protein